MLSGALIVQNDPFFDSRRSQILALSSPYRLPGIFHVLQKSFRRGCQKFLGRQARLLCRDLRHLIGLTLNS